MTGKVLGRSALIGLLGLAGCIEARPLNRPDLLAPIPPDYKAQIVKWATGFFAEPAALREARISAPLSIEDRSQNPLWLVCVEAVVRGPGGVALAPRRFAFGFNAWMQSAPQRRYSTALTSADCDRFPLRWQPFPELERIKAPPQVR